MLFQVAQVKLTTFENNQMNVYTIDKVPTLFDFNETGNIYPTVFYLWNNPKAYPVLICHEPVLQFLENGADLMLPGVIRSTFFQFPTIRKGGPVVIAFYNAEMGTISGPSAVGCAMMSSEEMHTCGFKGKGVQILHVFRDHLWEFGPKGMPPVYPVEGWGDIGKEKKKVEDDEEAQEVVAVKEEGCSDEEDPGVLGSLQEEKEPEDEEESMEYLLKRCFLAGLKHRFTRNMLPMDVGQFYTQCVLSCVPDGRRLDMKKTTYKKFGTFLQEMNKKEWIIKTAASKEKKGADVVTEVNFSNTEFREFRVTDEQVVDEAPDAAKKNKNEIPAIAEFFAITEPTLPLFPGKVKGDLLNVKQIRDAVTKYVNDNVSFFSFFMGKLL